MTKDDTEIVSIVRSALIDKVGQDVFDLWIGCRVHLEFTAGTLRIVAPDHFTLDRLRHKLRPDILDACQQALGEAPLLDFVVQKTSATASLAPEVAVPIAAKKTTALPATASTTERPTPSVPLRVVTSSPDMARRPLATLDTFVVGNSNCIAFAAVQRATASLGSVSPLYIYGPSGSGKSHLLEGILSNTRKAGRAHRAMMMSAEQFTSHFLEALHGSGLPNFRRKYRELDLLIIDDAHFFEGKRATLVEVQHTIDTLLRAGRQLVFAADRPPQQLAGLGPELSARLSGGLVCGVEPAEQTTRLGILKHFATSLGSKVPVDVLTYIAANLNADARQLRGALNRLHAMSLAVQQPVTMQLAHDSLGDLLRANHRVVKLADIAKAVCDVFGLEQKSLQSERKSRSVSEPRMLAMWLARKYTRAALSEIGHYFGQRSHTTVISANKKIENLIAKHGSMRLDENSCSVEDALRRVESKLRTG